jgi:hypothetical protein
MKRILLSCFVTLVAACAIAGSQQGGPTTISILSSSGSAEYSADGRTWHPLDGAIPLQPGCHVRTAPGSTVDLLLGYNGSVFRLLGDSELVVEKLERHDTGVEMVTDTRLFVERGTLIGSQRKLHKPSVLEVATPNGTATIRGTEYIVTSSGLVSVVSGTVDVIYTLPKNGGSVKATVPAGFTFNPATGTVVPTPQPLPGDVLAHVNTVRQNAEVYKAGGATIVVQAEVPMSPTRPKGNNGVGNGVDPQPRGNPRVNDGPGTGPGNPGNKGGPH